MEIVWIILQSETFNPTNKTQKCKIWIEKNILKYVTGLQPNRFFLYIIIKFQTTYKHPLNNISN